MFDAQHDALTLSKIWKLSKIWRNASIIWQTVNHVFAIGASAASFAVVFVSGTIENATSAIIILSLTSALLTLVGFACNPTRYMLNYRIAFQILNNALVSNTNEKGEIIGGAGGYEAIHQAIIAGERYIGKTYEVDFSLHGCDPTSIK